MDSLCFLNQLPRIIIETLIVCALLFLIIEKMAMGYTPMEIVPLLGVLALAAFRLMSECESYYNAFKWHQIPTPAV